MHGYGGGGCKAKREAKKLEKRQVVDDMKGLCLASADVLDPDAWKKKIVGDTC